MEQHLIIQLDVTPGQVAWLPVDATGRALGLAQQGTLEAAARMAAGRHIVALVPAEDVLLTRVDMPPGRRTARWLKAIPFALEERLVEDVESLHFAVGRAARGDDRLPVAAVAHGHMERWLTALRSHGLEPAALVPDCLALPWTPGPPTIVSDGGRTLCRDGECDGYTCEDALSGVFTAARHTDSADATPLTVSLEAGLLAALAPGAVTAPLNLMQGAYRRRRAGIEFGRWRVPAALAATLLLLVSGRWAFEYASLVREDARLRADIGIEFSRTLPGEPMIDARAQIERRLMGYAGGAGEWLVLFDAVSASLPRAAGVELQSISWRPGMMELSVTAQRAEQLDVLRGHLLASGHAASIESASSRGDRIEGRLRIRVDG